MAMFDAPGDDPASITYEVAGSEPEGAAHVSATVVPVTDAERLADAFGTAAAENRPGPAGTIGDEVQAGAADARMPAPLATRQPQSIVAANAWPAGDAAVSLGMTLDGAVGIARLQLEATMASATRTWMQSVVL
jgi:hypothetical protein